MDMGFAPTWLRHVSPPLLHVTSLTTVFSYRDAATGRNDQRVYASR